ncbi:MAG: effector binding domain-containing protein [Defluviitaleaceae bacterium]|nr:effector binding domain-containing protein [Defluviitaleaceae bacterium]
MDQLQTIGAVSKTLGISSRMIRYYERAGLLASGRADDYAYRVYDESNLRRLRQIIILRKLRIPIKQIREIFDNENAAGVIDVFERNISDLDEEITALSTVRSILQKLAADLREQANVKLQLDMLGDSSVFGIVESISLPNNIIREDKIMDDLTKADQTISKLTDRNVRIVYLPPSPVAAYQWKGHEPEAHVGKVMDKFVRDNGLHKIKPDIRHYGFNSPDPDENGVHGYEMWVTIPSGFDVTPPLTKKHFTGGLYGAHMISMGAFEEWGWLFEWSSNSAKYEYRSDTSMGSDNMNGLMEEFLNYHTRVSNPASKITDADTQLDLLIPIKEKEDKLD